MKDEELIYPRLAFIPGCRVPIQQGVLVNGHEQLALDLVGVQGHGVKDLVKSEPRLHSIIY